MLPAPGAVVSPLQKHQVALGFLTASFRLLVSSHGLKKFEMWFRIALREKGAVLGV